MSSVSSLHGCKDDNVGGSRAEQRDPEGPSSASAQVNHEETVDVELDDDQFLVERLLGKRVRRVRKRKVVQYLVKWKGYSEEENTWADETDIHDDLIEEYESASGTLVLG